MSHAVRLVRPRREVEAVPPDGGGAVVEVLRVGGREEQRTLRAAELVEQDIVPVRVLVLLSSLLSPPGRAGCRTGQSISTIIIITISTW